MNVNKKTKKNIFAIMGQAFGVYSANLKYMAVITVLAFVPVFVFRMFIPGHFLLAVEALMANADAIAGHFINYGYLTDAYNSAIMQNIVEARYYFMIFTGVELAFFPLSTAAALYLVDMHIKKQKPTFDGMFSAALPIFPKMLITSALVAIMVYVFFSFSLGFFGGILVVLAIYISVGMVFYQHVVADIRRWGPRAIAISRHMVHGRWFGVFFGIIIISLSYFIISFALENIVFLFGLQHNVFILLPLFLIQHFLLSYFAIVFALWYFDIKKAYEIRLQELEAVFAKRMENFMGKFSKDTKEMDENKKQDNNQSDNQDNNQNDNQDTNQRDNQNDNQNDNQGNNQNNKDDDINDNK